MAQFSDQTDLRTDAYPSALPKDPSKPAVDFTKDKKKGMSISAAALLLGGAAWSMWPPKESGRNDAIEPRTPTSDKPQGPANLPEDIEVAKTVNDSMPFNQAHTAAREEVGMGGVFNWCGNIYNTFLPDEWGGLSLEQRIDYVQIVIGEELPVQPAPIEKTPDSGTTTLIDKPTIIEGHLDGRRVIGIDDNNDGVIDQLVSDGGDGYNLMVVDATGDEGLDTLYKYDSLDGEWVMVQKIEHPVVLSNDDFSQGLEESMSREVVDSILEPEMPTTEDTADSTAAVESAAVESVAEEPATDDELKMPEDDEPIYLADHYHAEDDTYVNNGDVRDMDE